MGGADFARAEYSRRRVVTQSFQLSEDMLQNRCAGGVAPSVSFELCADDPLNIFEENKGRSSHSLETVEDIGEEVAGVLVSCSSSG
jgi:hypothetical protein